jgi:N-hydroxyarylamine O-acetyltransferase
MTASVAAEAVGSAWAGRYLALLGVAREAPSVEALGRLLRAHFARVPFENVTAILRRRAHPGRPVPPVDPAAMLADWEARRGGGVCFEIGQMFWELLVALGYRARPVMARISFPGSHQAVLVGLDGRRYLADAGTGAPFFEPIPLDDPFVVRRAGLSYRFRADEATPHAWVQERLIDGAWAPFTTYDLRVSTAEDRMAAYQRHHTPGVSWVTGTPRLVRCEEDVVSQLRDGELTRFTPDGKRVERLETPEDYERVAAEVFGVPNLPIREALVEGRG